MSDKRINLVEVALFSLAFAMLAAGIVFTAL